MIIKPILDAMGSSGGVAWSIFNTAFASLGLTIGGAAAGILGGASCVLFLVIGLPLLYVFCKEYKQKAQAARALLAQREDLINVYLAAYIDGIAKQYVAETSDNHIQEDTFIAYIQKTMTEDAAIKGQQFPLGQIILLALSRNTLLLKEVCEAQREIYVDEQDDRTSRLSIQIPSRTYQVIKDNNLNYAHYIPKSKPPFTALLISGFKGFVGGFGTIAGGTGGFAGLLIGMGVFAGFSAFPIIGLTCLALSLIAGIAVAVEVVSAAKQEHYAQQKMAGLKSMAKAAKGVLKDVELRNITISHTPEDKPVAEVALKEVQKAFATIATLKNTVKHRFWTLPDQTAPLDQPLLPTPNSLYA